MTRAFRSGPRPRPTKEMIQDQKKAKIKELSDLMMLTELKLKKVAK